MSTKHTPGPWRYKRSKNLLLFYGANGAAFDVTTLTSELAQEEANARLIAAAPELLEALRTIQQRCKGTRYANIKGLACIDAIAQEALAKVVNV